MIGIRGVMGALAALMLMSGCGVSFGPSQLGVGARVGSTLAGEQAGQQTTQGFAVQGGVTLTRVRVLVREVELYGAGLEIEKGPFLIDLEGAAFEGGVVKALATEVPPGTYQKVEFKVEPPLGGAASLPMLADHVAANASMLIDGLIDGAPFTFATSLAEHQEYEGAIVVGEANESVVLNLDPSRWFLDAQGGSLDPRQPGAKLAIEGNIRRSLHLYEVGDDHGGPGTDGGLGHDLYDDHGGDRPDDDNSSDDVNDDH